MGGKRRPAACVYVATSGAIALCPGTTLRSAQPGRVSVAGLARPTWLLAPLATLFPAEESRLDDFEPVGALRPDERAAMETALCAAYGAAWAALFERRARAASRPTRIVPRSGRRYSVF